MAHADLWGLRRGHRQPQAGDTHTTDTNFTPLAVHSAAQDLLATTAATRTVTYLGASATAADLVKWAAEADRQLGVLRPPP